MKKHLGFFCILILVIIGSLFLLWDYSYFLNEPVTLTGYGVKDINHDKIQLKDLWTDSEQNTYYYGKLNKTSMDIINFYNKPIKNGKEEMRSFYLDTSQEYLYKVNDKGEIITMIHWPKHMGKMVQAVSDNKGHMYIQWSKYDRYNSKIVEEGINKYSEKGKFLGMIFKKSYEGKVFPEAPYGKGFIKNLNFEKGRVYFYHQINKKITLYYYENAIKKIMDIPVDEMDFKIIDIIGSEPGQIYFDTNDSRFGIIDKKMNMVFLKDYLKENKVIGKIRFNRKKHVYIETLTERNVELDRYNGYGFISSASNKNQVDSIYKENYSKIPIEKLTYSKEIIRKKYIVLISYLSVLILIIYAIRFLYVYVFQNKVYIVFKQLMLLIPIILIGMLIFVLKTVVGGFGEFSNEIQSGKFHEFNQIIDRKIELVEKKYENPFYLGDLIDSIDLYEPMDPHRYKELYNLTKISDMDHMEDVKGMYVVIDKIENNQSYKILDSENNFKLYYPRFSKGDNKYFWAASRGAVVDAVGTGEKYIFTMKPIYNSLGKVAGIYQIGMYYEGYRKNLDMKFFTKSIVGIMITTLLIVFAVVFITYIILRSLGELTKTVKEVSAGNLDTQLRINSKDEIEDLSDAFNNMTSNIREYIDDITELSNDYYRFVPQEIFQILDKESVNEITLGEHKKFNMCILNAAIEDFYKISEKISAEESFKLINEYLKIIGPIIRKHNGVIEKYLDKGVVAIFPQNGQDAVEAGKDIISEVHKYNIYKSNNLPVGDIRIAIHKGPILIGIIGEEKRLQSSIVSDSANLVGLMRQKAKKLWANIIITDEVMKDIKDKTYLHRCLGNISMSDREETIELYDIYDADKKEMRQFKDKSKDLFETSVKNFKVGKFYDARSGFVEILDKNMEDNGAREYFYQSDDKYRNGVDKDWNESLKV
ncbi:MAG: HAMP domain-containing protein [Anaeromicrobium sp.]|jgi:class 3 adenylate cyclase/HAMP domain-containing protein|uniref:HAMP domain-containing protein n=1 Tax=Anaeromicrobium sp. TaxID=1929132 RepID=UPI0025F70A43|nr:HAMP domain-containing protein [Anaeromicrobium sp.]MCT4593099.1 HAMP domain-containing protein [Anaeromicrobium sp.]